jgi:hypothetical protein
MFDRKALWAHFEPRLTPFGALLGVVIAIYLLSGMLLLGEGNYRAGSALLFPLIPLAASMAYREWRTSLAKYPRLGFALGIVNAGSVVAALVFIGVQLYALSAV